MLGFCHIYATLLWTLFHNVTKICKPLVVYQFSYIVLYHSQMQCHMIIMIKAACVQKVKKNCQLLLDFSLTVKAATLIFISGCVSAISSA